MRALGQRATSTTTAASERRNTARSTAARRRVVPRVGDERNDDASSSHIVALATLSTALRRVDDARRANDGARGGWIDVAGARVRLPRGARPWACAHFVGGAALGAFPDVAYDGLLTRCADETGVAIIATAYDVDLNHEKIAKACGETYARARAEVCEREGLDARTTPTFRFGHSLGCKLVTILACEDAARGRSGGIGGVAGDGTIDMDWDEASGTAVAARPSASGSGDVAVAGHFMVAFNNADAADSVKLIEKFARELLKKRTGESGGVGADFFSSLPSLSAFAERAVKAAGLEFVPTPKETLERARTRFVSRRTRLIKFKNDDLDQNRELMEALETRFKVYPGRVDARELDFGNHLTPVYFSLDGLKLSPALEKLVGQFSLGDEEGVKRLADEFSAFIREK